MITTLIYTKKFTKVTFIIKVIFITFVKKQSNMADNNKNIKVLRVEESLHQLAKINAAKRGVLLRAYVESLIAADEAGKIRWD